MSQKDQIRQAAKDFKKAWNGVSQEDQQTVSDQIDYSLAAIRAFLIPGIEKKLSKYDQGVEACLKINLKKQR